MTLDQQLAQYELSIYDKGVPAPWDSLVYGEVVFGTVRIDGLTAVVFPGTRKGTDDWTKDVDIIPDPVRGMGIVHRGFFQGMVDVWKTVKQIAGDIVVSGHSLGAARATILAGLMKLSGKRPVARVCWGEPAEGFGNFADLVRDIPARSYRNCLLGTDGKIAQVDPITCLPLPPYVHATPFINLCLQEKPSDFIETTFEECMPHGWLHNMTLYARHTT